MNDWKVPLSDIDILSIDGSHSPEIDFVTDVMKSRWLTMGNLTKALELEFATLVGANHAIAVSSGTAALHLALLALGIGPGDEVIVPSLSFVATANAVLYTGAQVVFADIISTQDLTIDPKDIENKINNKTKAIIVMHYGGYPCKIDEIYMLAKANNLFLIEDAAHAPGASYKDNPLGSWGDIGCFSFYGNKNMVTAEGGMVVTGNDDLAERINLLRSHGMTALSWDKYQGHASSYDVVELGFNYRIDDIRSAIGLCQLQRLNDNNRKRSLIAETYRDLIYRLNLNVVVPFEIPRGKPAYHLFPILIPIKKYDLKTKQTFMEIMKEGGIQTSVHYPPIHQFTYYHQYYPDIYLPKTEEVSSREITLPLYPTMTNKQIELVLTALSHACDILGG